jgi:heat shock protein HslJ
MNMKKILVGVVIVIILLIAGMGVFKMKGNNVPLRNETATTTPSSTNQSNNPYDEKRLEGKVWTWMSVTYNDGTTITPTSQKAGAFTLTINDDGSFSALTDCNHFAGTVTVDNGAISFTDIFSTEMYCRGSQEQDFYKVLERAAGYLFTPKGELVLDIERDSGSAIFK